MAIDRTAYNALVDDDGSNTVGTQIVKNTIKTVLLDPIDAAIAAAVTGLAESVVTGLVADLAAKAPLAAPALTGIPTAPTAAVGTNTTQLASTAFSAAAVAVETAARVAADAASVNPAQCEGRLTLTALTPITSADVSGATAIKWTPYKGNRTALFDGVSAWVSIIFAETSLALGTLTAALPYDVFAWNNAGTLALELLAWTNTTTRATALVVQDGVLVKSGATTRRYLGTFYTTSTTTTEDSAVKRYVWNYYNRDRRPLLRQDATGTWTYTTATVRQANAAAANQVEVVIGVAESTLDLLLNALAQNSTGLVNTAVGIGEDSLTTFAAGAFANGPAAVNAALVTRLAKKPAIGRHVYSWNEYSVATGTTTWVGTLTIGGVTASGLVGSIDA